MRTNTTKTQGMRLGVQIPSGPCVHVDNGRAGIPKNCIRYYECWHCAFDQWLEAMEEGQKAKESFKIPRDILAKAA